MRGSHPIRRAERTWTTGVAAVIVIIAAIGLAGAQQADRTIEEIKAE
jgi:hypothetical protein